MNVAGKRDQQLRTLWLLAPQTIKLASISVHPLLLFPKSAEGTLLARLVPPSPSLPLLHSQCPSPLTPSPGPKNIIKPVPSLKMWQPHPVDASLHSFGASFSKRQHTPALTHSLLASSAPAKGSATHELPCQSPRSISSL